MSETDPIEENAAAQAEYAPLQDGHSPDGPAGVEARADRPELPPAAQRALAEAAARRAEADAQAAARAKEIGGRNGPEPTRFGDWEKNGLAVDF